MGAYPAPCSLGFLHAASLLSTQQRSFGRRLCLSRGRRLHAARGSPSTSYSAHASFHSSSPSDDEPVVIMSGLSYSSSYDDEGGQTSTARGRALAGPAGGSGPQVSAEVSNLKMQLLSSVASLDRGIAAYPSQQKKVDSIVSELEGLGRRPVQLEDRGEGMAALDGRWRLLYSSAFGSGSLGGRQPGPPAAIVPFSIGQVFQDIDTYNMKLDNVVQLCFRVPTLPFVQEDTEPVVAEITLGHTFKVFERSKISITFETTDVKVSGPGPLTSIPKLSVPKLPQELQPPQDLRSAVFEVRYLDRDMRITRGDRGELRIYVRGGM